jgi:hypothetical protein
VLKIELAMLVAYGLRIVVIVQMVSRIAKHCEDGKQQCSGNKDEHKQASYVAFQIWITTLDLDHTSSGSHNPKCVDAARARDRDPFCSAGHVSHALNVIQLSAATPVPVAASISVPVSLTPTSMW